MESLESLLEIKRPYWWPHRAIVQYLRQPNGIIHKPMSSRHLSPLAHQSSDRNGSHLHLSRPASRASLRIQSHVNAGICTMPLGSSLDLPHDAEYPLTQIHVVDTNDEKTSSGGTTIAQDGSEIVRPMYPTMVVERYNRNTIL